MSQYKSKTKVYVAMSGGVDSSVAAALLKKQSFDVTGVFFKPWQPSAGTLGSNFCTWQQDRADAMRVAAKLGIPFKTWDFSKEYERDVVGYMVDTYKAGFTPNPDVMCNKEVKFGLFLKKALAEGADYIATGHYARLATSIRQSVPKTKSGRVSFKSTLKCYTLYAGSDKNKDQSYFLWTLTQKQLKYCLFPVGDYAKPAVRKLAQKFNLPVWDKEDSQGVCFVGHLDMKEFLKRYIKPKSGEIILAGTKNAVGHHDGVFYYTIGQRHGLNIGDGGGPYYVVSKDIKKNIIFVAKESQAAGYKSLTAKVAAISWVGNRLKLPGDCKIKIRYRSESMPALVSGNGREGFLSVRFKKPVKAVTPGQSAVFYRGQEVLGGGIIV